VVKSPLHTENAGFKAMRAVLSTRGDTAMLIDRHAASNIHFGSSNQRPDALPSRLQWRMPPARFSITHGHEQHARTMDATDRGPRAHQSYGRCLVALYVALYNESRPHQALATRQSAAAWVAKVSPVDWRCAWTTLARRPQLHRAKNSKTWYISDEEEE
jgi:hypothetical protein